MSPPPASSSWFRAHTPCLCQSTTRLLLAALSLCAQVSVTACGPDTPAPPGERRSFQDDGGPALALLDSVTLDESDSAYIGFPAIGFTVDDRGLIYVPDMFGKRLYRFTPDGRLDRTFGAPGRGPGEFGSMGPATIVHDSIVLQGTSRQLVAFHRENGRYLFTRRTQGYVVHGFVRTDTDFLAYFDYGTRRGLLRLPASELLAPDTGPVPQVLRANLLPVPREYDEFPELVTLSGSTVAAWADTVAVGFGGTQHLRLATPDGTVLEEVAVPVRNRRGIPDGAYDVYTPGPIDFRAQVEAVSNLREIWRLPSGRLAVLILDGWVEEIGGDEKSFETAWISLVDLGTRQACVDTRLPFPGTDKPRVAMRGDTLYALDQVGLPGDSLSLQTVVRRYLVQDDGCDWLPLEARTPDE